MDNLVGQGFELAMFGMGTVFLFLALLIVATQFMSNVIQRFPPQTNISSAATATQQQDNSSNPRLIAVISAAITQHRASRK